MSLPQWISILWAYRKQSLIIASSIIAVAAIACALWPRTYSATATLIVDYDVNDPSAGKDFPVMLLGSYIATQIELAQTPEVLLPVIARLRLVEKKDYAAGYSGDGGTLPQWVETKLRKNLLVEQGHLGSNTIHITYSADDPAEAALVANNVAEIYSQQQRQRLTGPAAERAKRYKEQLDELKAKVIGAQDEVTRFHNSTGVSGSDARIDIALAMLNSLEQKLLDAQNAQRVAEMRVASDQNVGSQVLSSPLIQSLKTQLALQTSNLAQLRATLGQRHPQVMELQAQINATRASMKSEVGTYTSNAAAEVASARRLEKGLQTAVQEQRDRVSTVRQVLDEGSKYQLELDSAQSVYKRALDGFDQVMFASSGGYTNIGIESRATPPLKPSKPKVGMVMLLAAAAGLMLGLAGPMCYELMNRRVRCRDDLERDHGIPVLVELGRIPLTRSLA
ncbi:MAG: hypothetical protein ABIY56_04815 [Dokdonella sp.]